MSIKSLYTVFAGGSLGQGNLLTSTNYDYDEETFEFKGYSSLYDGGAKAHKEGAFTFDSVKSFIESKGKTKLVPILPGQLS